MGDSFLEGVPVTDTMDATSVVDRTFIGLPFLLSPSCSYQSDLTTPDDVITSSQAINSYYTDFPGGSECMKSLDLFVKMYSQK